MEAVKLDFSVRIVSTCETCKRVFEQILHLKQDEVFSLDVHFPMPALALGAWPCIPVSTLPQVILTANVGSMDLSANGPETACVDCSVEILSSIIEGK